MAEILPFRGYRYDRRMVGDITDVVAPPYDRIDPGVQRACYGRSRYNVVRITKGAENASDGPADNVYTRAAGFLREWTGDGILVRDAVPALYAYHQTYSFAGESLTRKGVVALGRLEPERVHAHERTLRGPKEDRLKLIRATEANFGHIFMLYSDPARSADAAIARAIASREPDIIAEDGDRNLHRVWAITDARTISTVQGALSSRDLYIADGHHRYETAVVYMRECEAKGWRPAAPESFDVRMMTLFNVHEPGMSIRPIHRLVHGVSDFEAGRLLSLASADFVVERHPSFDEMREATASGAGGHTFGCATADVFATLRLREGVSPGDLVRGDASDDFKRLDVSILHAGILEPLLGVDAEALEEERNVTYTVDAREGMAAVASGEEQVLFYLNPTSADEVLRVAGQGEKMPQKSTDFYPKLLTGLVMSRMEIEKPA